MDHEVEKVDREADKRLHLAHILASRSCNFVVNCVDVVYIRSPHSAQSSLSKNNVTTW